MCNLISDVVTCCARSCNTGKINASDKTKFENPKKRKYGNKRYFYTNLHLKDRLDIEFTAFLRRADARGSAEIFYRI